MICTVGIWNRYCRTAREAAAFVIRGILERSTEGVTNLRADRLRRSGSASATPRETFDSECYPRVFCTLRHYPIREIVPSDRPNTSLDGVKKV